MDDMQRAEVQLAALAAHLAARRDIILQAWRQAAESDPELTAVSSLSRMQFNDHVPEVLDAFQRKLTARQIVEKTAALERQKESAADHGLHRWQHGYTQREVIREWAHLHMLLVDELEKYTSEHPTLSANAMPIARRALAQLFGEGIVESATRYARLQQVEAAGQLRDLEQAVRQLKELERQRGEMLRETAHDLRGNLGVVKNVTAVLNFSNVPETVRAQFLTKLQKGVDSLHALLNDLMSLARLEAGQERRTIDEFDVAASIRDLCASMQFFAEERALWLKDAGPAVLLVQGDAVKIQRIVQNLLYNALKYTEHGGVRVTWEESATAGRERWILCVQDTGPGFGDGPVTPLAQALKAATEESQQVEDHPGETSEQATPAPTLTSQSDHRPPSTGEGIGLSIVKRLCELLDATLELETARGKGSTFRVIFPRRYEAS